MITGEDDLPSSSANRLRNNDGLIFSINRVISRSDRPLWSGETKFFLSLGLFGEKQNLWAIFPVLVTGMNVLMAEMVTRIRGRGYGAMDGLSERLSEKHRGRGDADILHDQTCPQLGIKSPDFCNQLGQHDTHSVSEYGQICPEVLFVLSNKQNVIL